MRKMSALIVTFICVASASAFARDDAHFLSISQAMQTSDFKERLNPNVKLYFADQIYPQPREIKMEVVSNRKTNAFGKSDQAACEWVLLSALLALQERAVLEGGNAVVGITSYYKKNEFVSATEYECHAGAIMAGVALKGRIATLP